MTGSTSRILPARFLIALIVIGVLVWLSIPLGPTEGGIPPGYNGLYFRRAFIEEIPSPADLKRLAALGRELDVRDFYFHHTPATTEGALPPINPQGSLRTAEYLRAQIPAARCWLWIGGRTDGGIDLSDPGFRSAFIENAVEQLQETGFAGLHLNFEPLPSGDRGFVALLDEMRDALPEEMLLSVAAIAPSTFWRRGAKLCWSWDYYRVIAAHCDQLMVMSYDTAIPFPRLYQETLRSWVRGLERELAENECDVLMGVPCYGEWRIYHHPWAENRKVAEAALLPEFGEGSGVVSGVAFYAEWTM